jgi:hypothetical protein
MQMRIVALTFVAAMQLFGADPRIGNWKLVSAKVTTDRPNIRTITAVPNGIRVADSPAGLESTARFDGRDYPVQGVPAFNQISPRQIDKGTIEVTNKKDGKFVNTFTFRVLHGGMEMTGTSHYPDGRPDQIAAYTRTGGTKDPGNLVIGEWTVNRSKSEMLTATPLKFEAEGADGVRMSWGFSYSAKFDGKDYPLQNSRDDTVMLRQIDAHTVEAIYKRAGKIADRDRWVVFPDGKRLTLTADGTLRSGTHIHTEEVFEKQ